ncbi:hypothetical protein DRN75_02335 [Nanoarchaeota archaeon]|nr:MAG: hypothetical protein DRN75_02335 [Nanoarchaeota archaeon]
MVKFNKKPKGLLANAKSLAEKLKKRVKPQDCPYLGTCDQIVLEEEFRVLCKDQEVSQNVVMLHAAGQHAWQVCPYFRELERKKKGKKPREWNKQK